MANKNNCAAAEKGRRTLLLIQRMFPGAGNPGEATTRISCSILSTKGRCQLRRRNRPGRARQLKIIRAGKQRCTDSLSESSNMLLYLAGVNEHAVFRIVGSKRWSVAHFLKTIQYLLEYGVRLL